MTRHNRNRFLAIVLLAGMLDKRLIFMGVALATMVCPASAKQPNVIVIMTDDQGNNVGFQGNPHVTTPPIDRLAEQSVRLTNFHQMPMCTASRAALMTGKYAEQTGAWRTSLGRTLTQASKRNLLGRVGHIDRCRFPRNVWTT
jgi:hypothetical protein